MADLGKLRRCLGEGCAGKDPFYKNEVRSNVDIAFLMLLVVALYGVAVILNFAGVFSSTNTEIISVGIAAALLIAPAVTSIFYKGDHKALKYCLIYSFLFFCVVSRIFYEQYSPFVLALCLVLACRYFDPKFTITVSGIMLVGVVVSDILSCVYGPADLNLASPAFLDIFYDEESGFFYGKIFDVGGAISYVLRFNTLPSFLTFIALGVAVVAVSYLGRRIVNESVIAAAKQSSLESELELAKNIQANMLPKHYPLFPSCKDFDVTAVMHAAKEVGGDFYDAFVVDDNHIAVVVADVSGKGIPAALFMAISKTIIKIQTMHNGDPADAFGRVNHLLCEGNETGLFVTAWIGVIDTTNGQMVCVNAGHTPPLIYKKGGQYTYENKKSGLVLAGMDGMKYKPFIIQLERGDRLFLYTDGVTEAMNPSDEQYGFARLQNFMNSHADVSISGAIRGLEEDIHKFADGTPQSDDITMLLLEYLESPSTSKSFPAKVEELDNVMDYALSYSEAMNASEKDLQAIRMAVEETFVNICHYAYEDSEGEATLVLSHDTKNEEIRFVLSDSGKPFNPLDKEDPDTHADSASRKIGGLGIFLTKKMMDETSYSYLNGQNILTMRKKITKRN